MDHEQMRRNYRNRDCAWHAPNIGVPWFFQSCRLRTSSRNAAAMGASTMVWSPRPASMKVTGFSASGRGFINLRRNYSPLSLFPSSTNIGGAKWRLLGCMVTLSPVLRPGSIRMTARSGLRVLSLVSRCCLLLLRRLLGPEGPVSGHGLRDQNRVEGGPPQ